MANQVVSVISQKHEGNYYFLYVISVFQADENTGVEFIDLKISETDIVIRYKINTTSGAATFIPLRRDVHLGGASWANLPENHRVTVELYQSNGTTKINDGYMETKDSPILR